MARERNSTSPEESDDEGSGGEGLSDGNLYGEGMDMDGLEDEIMEEDELLI